MVTIEKIRHNLGLWYNVGPPFTIAKLVNITPITMEYHEYHTQSTMIFMVFMFINQRSHHWSGTGTAPHEYQVVPQVVNAKLGFT